MFDVHVHAAPDVVARAATDVETVAAYERAGFTGCVLKGHCESTVGRAAAAAAGRSTAVFGGVTLNRPLGGPNPVAVTAALTMGARIVWLPTVDALRHRRAGLAHPPSCAPALDAGPGYAIPPVDWSTEADVRTILGLVADADAVLATGHVGVDEAAWVVAAARSAGVRRVLLTHPSFTVPGMTAPDARELTELGAYAEVTAYQLLHQPGWDAERLARFITTVGYDRCVLSSDAGQPDSPSPPEALSVLVDALASAGCDRGAVAAMASEIPEALVVQR